MLSQNDIRLSQLALSENYLTKEQLQEILRTPKARDALNKGVSLLLILKGLGYITQSELDNLLARHIIVRCTLCFEKTLVVGPNLPTGMSCSHCGGEFKVVTPSSFNQTPNNTRKRMSGVMSQSDIRLGQLAISERVLTSSQFQEIFRSPEIRTHLGEGFSLIEVLKNLGFLSQSGYDQLLARHILIQCKTCNFKTKIVGPTIPQGFTCDYCGGDLEIITPSSFDKTPSPGNVRGMPLSSLGQTPLHLLTQNQAPNDKTNLAVGTSLEQTSGITEQAVEQDELIGQSLGGCEVLKKIGQGGMGSVYLGEHLGLKTKVALKLLPPNSVNPELVSRFYQEARSIARIDHANVVRVQDVGEKDNRYYLVMQFIDGHTMESEIQKKGHIHWIRACKLVRSVAMGLKAAHEENIVHCDVKPENIMIPKKGEAKVTDFGLAQDIHGPAIGNPGKVIGTSYFMSPEQCNGILVDLRTDIYSLGISFYYAVTGQKPLIGYSLTEIMMKHLSENPISPSALIESLPITVEQIICKMMAKDREQRYFSMDELIKDLSALLVKRNPGDPPISLIAAKNPPPSFAPPEAPKAVVSFSSASPVQTQKEDTDAPVLEALDTSADDSVDSVVSNEILALVKALKNEDPVERKKAVLELGKLGNDAEVAVLALIRILKDDDKMVRKAVVKTLTELGHQVEIVPILTEALEDENWVIRAYIAEVLGGIGAVVVPNLIKALNDEHWLVRAHAAEALSGIGREAKEAVPALICTLEENSDWAVRKSVSQALAGIGKEAVLPLLKLLRNNSEELNKHIQQTLVAIGEEGVSILVEALKTSQNDFSLILIDLLKEIGEAAQDAVPILVERLNSQDETLVEKIGEALKHITGKEVESFLPEEQEADEDGFNEEELREILASLNEDEETLIERRETQKLKLREEKEAIAVQTTSELNEFLESLQEEQIGNVGADELASESLIVRTDQELNLLMESLTEPPSQNASFTPLQPLLQPIENIETPIPTAASEKLASLIQELQDEDEDVRINATEILKTMGMEAELAIPFLINLLMDENREVRDAVVQTLSVLGTQISSTLKVLIESLDHQNWVVRTHAAKVIGNLGLYAKPGIPALIETLKDEHWVIRKQAAESLGNIGVRAQEIKVALTQALQDEDAMVRKEAMEALKKINF